MHVVLLITDKMAACQPKEITFLENWGSVSICDDNGNFLAEGTHCYIRADEAVIKKWANACSEFIVGQGSPMMQQFIVHRNDQERNQKTNLIKTKETKNER